MEHDVYGDVHVVWVSYHEEDGIIARGYWDQGLLELVFDHSLWRPQTAPVYRHVYRVDEVPDGCGAIVVVPGQHHVGDVARLNEEISRLPWLVLVVTGDECGLFPVDAVEHPSMMKVLMVGCAGSADVWVVDGFKADTRSIIAELHPIAPEKSVTVGFAGQVTHQLRVECAEAVNGSSFDHECHVSEGFTQGLPREDYLELLCRSVWAPAPSGACMPSSFRLYEALEAGCIPIVDGGYRDHLWWNQHVGVVPFPVIGSWEQLDSVIASHRGDEVPLSVRCSVWWLKQKRRYASAFAEMVRRHVPVTPAQPTDVVTAVVTTSPIGSHPSTAILEQTISSIRRSVGDCEIVIACDGVRSEQEHRRGDYMEYLRRVLWLAHHHWHNVMVHVEDEFQHQAGVTTRVVELIDTPLMLFVEHDTPLTGDIPWQQMCNVLLSTDPPVKVIRLSHEAEILDVHRYLMLDDDPVDVGVPVVRTKQWSQRPHLALVDWYADMLYREFEPWHRTFIEDVVHSRVQVAWDELGDAAWEVWPLAIYHPDGDIKRSTHTDGRGDEPKYAMVT